MLTRAAYEKLEYEVLAPYASTSLASRGRVYSETEHPYRSRFQRDRDRVIHARAFRRLEYKTQVYVYHEGDYYRTRLTHSLEVAQIARTIARILRLNEDLAEAISLAHDLGHTPFGHSGEAVMNKLMEKFGGFEHNRQSFRIVTLLENNYANFRGLNLTYEVLDGIAKHRSEYDMPDGSHYERKGFPSLEAQVCNCADEIAYNNHDIDDGLKSELLKLDDLRAVELWEENFQGIKRELAASPLKLQELATVRKIIDLLVTDLIQTTLTRLEERGIKTLADVWEKGDKLVGYSDKVHSANIELKKFLYQKLYRHHRVERMASKAERLLTDLFCAYQKNPRLMPPEFADELKDYPIERVICDYIAGMTDRFALEEHKRLFDPHTRV